jgi:hypothetical protein
MRSPTNNGGFLLALFLSIEVRIDFINKLLSICNKINWCCFHDGILCTFNILNNMMRIDHQLTFNRLIVSENWKYSRYSVRPWLCTWSCMRKVTIHGTPADIQHNRCPSIWPYQLRFCPRSYCQFRQTRTWRFGMWRRWYWAAVYTYSGEVSYCFTNQSQHHSQIITDDLVQGMISDPFHISRNHLHQSAFSCIQGKLGTSSCPASCRQRVLWRWRNRAFGIEVSQYVSLSD